MENPEVRRESGTDKTAVTKTNVDAGPPARVPLWEVESELERAYDMLDLNEGAHDPEAEAIVASALNAALEKRDRVAGFLKTIQAYESHLEKEIDSLQEKRERATVIRARLLSYVGQVMTALGVRKLRGNAYEFAIVKNPPKVVIDDFEKLPERFVKVETIREPKREEIKAALKAGELIQGVRLEQGERVAVK